MMDALRRLLGVPREPVTRMTRTEALATAQRAAAAAGLDEELSMAVVRRDDSRLLWVVSTPTAGSGWSVEIDDATGDVGSPERWGVR